ncbi:Protein of unknown function [Lentzea albidocapillata subsp. violacea]|uniref:DUF3040 domain-containing protein n=1 Tax=Lentzea albidocapillata subsp. violacea TaxID=128104 RepID=A0A1G9XWN7_9PSEU|nr:DUF3040 domain-containing protein [Lentzea albidocapillata]SDN00886.1 Protein of unknown function [Lentzea albidocapillata subsp. violacea]
MELPDREKQALHDIERRLMEEDPKLAAKLNRAAPRVHVSRGIQVVIGMLAVYVAGLIAVMVGVTLSSVVLIVLGGCVIVGMFAVFAVRVWRRRRD